jgi:hypothetical protein
VLTSAALGLLSLPSLASLAWASRRKTFDEPKRNPYRGSDDQLLDEIERTAFDFCELSSIDASLLLCGVLTARPTFQ